MADAHHEHDPSGVVPPLFVKHDRVRHPEFGRGYVVDSRGDNCRVFFLEDGKTRDFKQSKLEPSS